MSMDHSLKSRSTLTRHRNVLTRAERIDYLKGIDRWTDESSTKGLPKVPHRKLSVGKKAKAEKKPAAEGETPADDKAKKE